MGTARIVVALGAALVHQQSTANWELKQSQDALTLSSEQKLSFQGKGGKAILICKLGSNRVRFVILSDTFVGSARVKEIQYRVGNQEPASGYWRYNSDYTAEPFNSKELIRILESIQSEKDALFRLYRYDHATVDISVDFSGSQEATKAWKTACGIVPATPLKSDA